MATDFTAQLQINGTWTTVPVLVSNGARITGGVQKDAAVADPLTCTMTLRDNDSSLSARNPRGPYFGYLGRATPARVSVPDTTHLWLSTGTDLASTPDTAALDIVGDLDIRIDVEPLYWPGSTNIGLVGKYQTSGDQRSYALFVSAAGLLGLSWSTAGTSGTLRDAYSTVPFVPDGAGRIALRAVLDVDNGASGNTVTFYTAPGGSLTGTWTQLGDPVVTAGVTSIYSGSAVLQVGPVGNSPIRIGRVHAAQVRSGIGGTVVANPDFTAQTSGATSFVDSTGKTWTLSGAQLRNFDLRACGEVADWPVRWTTAGRTKTAEVELAGWLRNLQRPSVPLRSPLFREATSAANTALMVGYWPGEDGSAATSLASGLTGGAAMTFGGTPSLASSGRIPGSDQLLELATGVSLTGAPAVHASSGMIAFRMVADVPATGWTADAVVAEVKTTGGSVARWVLEVSSTGGLRLRGLASDSTVVEATSYISFGIMGKRQMIGWQLTQTGSDIYWQIFTRVINDDLTVAESGLDGTFTGRTVGKSSQVRIAPGGTLDGGAVGHIMLGTSTALAAGIDKAIVGNDGETCGARLVRLGAELGIPIRIIGNVADTERMGPQQPGTAIELFTACAVTDRGILSEARDAMVLEYRTRVTLYNQTARATLTYGSTGESPRLEPDEPNEDVVNDYTAERRDGSSYQAVQTIGRLSTQTHPYGVGPRPGSGTLDVETDLQLYSAAWWEVHLGTWDDLRYPAVRIDQTRLVDVGKTSLARAIAAARPGDRLVINSPPVDVPPHPIELQVQGWNEEIRPRSRTLTFNTLPGAPWLVGVVATDLVDSDGTTTVGSLAKVTPGTSQAVSVNVVGTPWSTSANTPFVMWLLHPTGAKAERVTVTAISGTSSPQSMTITRGLDGYTIAHAAGAALVLFQPLRWAR